MHRICRRLREDDFRIAGELDDLADPRTIDDAHQAQFDVVLGGDSDLGMNVQPLVAAPKFSASLGEYRLVVIRTFARRLIRAGPDLATLDVAEITEGAPVVASSVFSPSRNRKIVPATAAASGVGDHDVVAAVRQQLHLRDRRGGGCDDTHRRFRLDDIGADSRDLLDMWKETDRFGNPLLQEQKRRLKQRLRFESLLHWTIEEQII